MIFSKALSLCSAPHVTDQVSHEYTKQDKLQQYPIGYTTVLLYIRKEAKYIIPNCIRHFVNLIRS